MVKLYEMAHSPFCIPIALILRQAGIRFESIDVPNWDRSGVIEVTGGNYYQVPVLVDGEEVVYETSETSLNIARHVDRRFCGLRLFPPRISGIHEIVVGHIEDELEGFSFKLTDIHYLEAIENTSHRLHVIRHKERRFGRGCVEAWREDAYDLRQGFLSALDHFRGALTENDFLFGEEPVYADYALYGVIGNFAYAPQNRLGDDQDWILAWRDRLEAFELGKGEWDGK